MILSYVRNGHEFTVDFAQLPEASKEFLIRYGFKQWLPDAWAMTAAEKAEHGSAIEEVIIAKAEAKLDRLRAGTITERANAKESVDPTTKLRNAVIMEELEVYAKDQNKTLPTRTGKKADPEKLDKLMAAWYAQYAKRIDSEVARRQKKVDLVPVSAIDSLL